MRVLFAGLHARPLPVDSWHSLLNSVIRDLERIFQAAATGFSCDSAQETRNSGKRLLVSLQPLLQVVQSCFVLFLCLAILPHLSNGVTNL
jgi:hypothetical protein